MKKWGRIVLKIKCAVCGSYIEVKDLKEIENNICPICLTLGSLYIAEGDNNE